jgi:hypothetical protein
MIFDLNLATSLLFGKSLSVRPAIAAATSLAATSLNEVRSD